MNELNQLINRLKSDKMLYFDIQDIANNRLIDNNQTADNILQNYGDMMTYFKSFHSERVKKIAILVKRKNGNRFNKKQPPVVIEFKPKEPVHTALSLSGGATAQPSDDKVQFQGLGGGAKALPLDEYIEMNYTKKEFEKLQVEYDKLKAQYTKERKKRKKYENILLDKSTTPFFETHTGKEMLGMVKSFAPVLLEKVSSAGAGALAGGTTASELDGLSPTKIEFFKSILKDDRLDDTGVNDLTAIAVGMVNVEAFNDAINSLMYEYELKTLD